MVKKILPLLHVRDLSNTKEPSDVASLIWVTAEVKEKKDADEQRQQSQGVEIEWHH